VRPARALPYVLDAQGTVDAAQSELKLQFANRGTVAAVFQVRAGSGATAGSWTYTMGAGAELVDSLAFTGSYDFSVYGPNGFYRSFKGEAHAGLETELRYEVEHDGVTLLLHNHGAQTAAVSVLDGYTKKVVEESVSPGPRCHATSRRRRPTGGMTCW
jgi:phospholipase C